MKNINKFLLILFAVIISNELLANTVSSAGNLSISEIFSPAKNDISIKLIKSMFGSNIMIGALKSGPSNNLISAIFKILNTGVIFIAGILLSYTTVTGVVRTSQDGGMSQMGKITPLSIFRIFSGFILMGPIPNIGFSTIQAGIIWAAVHGIGFADTIFNQVMAFNSDTTNATVSNPEGYEIEVVRPRKGLKIESVNEIKYVSDEYSAFFNSDNNYSYSLVSNVNFLMNEVDKQLQDRAFVSPTDAASEKFKKATSILSPSGSGAKFFASSAAAKAKVGYGDISVSAMCLALLKYYQNENNQSEKNSNIRSMSECNDKSANLCFGTEKTRDICGSYNIKKYDVNSLKYMALNDFVIYSEFIKQYFTNINDIQERSFKIEDKEERKLFIEKEKESTKISLDSAESIVDDLVKIARTVPEPKTVLSKERSEKSDLGWVAAVYSLNDISSGFKSALNTKGNEVLNFDMFDKITAKILTYISKGVKASYSITSGDFDNESGLYSYKLNFVQNNIWRLSTEFISGIIGADSAKLKALPSKCNPGKEKGCFKQAIDEKFIVSAEDYKYTDQKVPGLLSYIAAQNKGLFTVNPMDQFKHSGIILMNSVGNFWKTIPQQLLTKSRELFGKYRGLMTGITVASGVIQSGLVFLDTPGYIMAAALDVLTVIVLAIPQIFYKFDIASFFIYVPAASALTVYIFGVSLILAVWIPFIPYLVFILSVIGWLFYLIEALVAAPLIAVGITHPEGQDFLGQAQQSFMLVLLVFLRPALILLGLITAVGIFHCVTYLGNIGFLNILQYIVSKSTGSEREIFLFLMLYLFTYAMLMSSITQMAFTNITLVVEKVSRWIGGQPENSPIMQILDRIKADINQKSQQAAMGAGSTLSDGASKANSVGKKGEIDRDTPKNAEEFARSKDKEHKS